MKILPLFYYPSTWVWVDDDRNLLTAMTDAFSLQNTVKPFLSAKESVSFLEAYRSPLSQHHFLTVNPHDENYGLLQRTPMDFDVTMIAKLLDDPTRFDEISCMVIDYNMPEMTGFALAKAVNSFLPVPKILLTGTKEENKAIEGFNDSLIQRFVQKGHEYMLRDLSNYLSLLTVQYFERLSFPLLAYLETEHKLPLSDPVFIEFFENHCELYDIKEYYLIDKQGSFLCVDVQGKRSYFVVHTERSIEEWISLYGEDYGGPQNLYQ